MEIKLRAFLKSTKKFVHTNDWAQLGLYGWNSFLKVLSEEHGYTPKLELWTGQVDKNKNDIYEGDLLLLSSFNLGTHIVIFDNGMFGVRERGYFHSFLDEEMWSMNIEIVGNIYKNTKPPESNPRA
jgi:hypothetical protein